MQGQQEIAYSLEAGQQAAKTIDKLFAKNNIASTSKIQRTLQVLDAIKDDQRVSKFLAYLTTVPPLTKAKFDAKWLTTGNAYKAQNAVIGREKSQKYQKSEQDPQSMMNEQSSFNNGGDSSKPVRTMPQQSEQMQSNPRKIVPGSSGNIVIDPLLDQYYQYRPPKRTNYAKVGGTFMPIKYYDVTPQDQEQRAKLMRTLGYNTARNAMQRSVGKGGKQSYLFSQYAPEIIKKAQYAQSPRQLTVYQDRDIKSNDIFKQLKNLGKQVYFDGDKAKWSGGYIHKKDQQRKQHGNLQIKKYNKNIRNSIPVLAQSLSKAQVTQFVPQLVSSIVESDQHLSRYGIGRTSQGSLPLYAGRWVDPATGRIRVLPQASTKFINPISYQQRIGYSQARIINAWNKFVLVQQQYMNLLDTPQEKWKQKQIQSINSGLDFNRDADKKVKKMKRTVQSFLLGRMPTSSGTYKLFTAIGTGPLALILGQSQISDQNKIEQCSEFVNQSVRDLVPGATASSAQWKNFRVIVDAGTSFADTNVQLFIRSYLKYLKANNLTQQGDTSILMKLSQFQKSYPDTIRSILLTHTPKRLALDMSDKPPNETQLADQYTMKKNFKSDGGALIASSQYKPADTQFKTISATKRQKDLQKYARIIKDLNGKRLEA